MHRPEQGEEHGANLPMGPAEHQQLTLQESRQSVQTRLSREHSERSLPEQLSLENKQTPCTWGIVNPVASQERWLYEDSLLQKVFLHRTSISVLQGTHPTADLCLLLYIHVSSLSVALPKYLIKFPLP